MKVNQSVVKGVVIVIFILTIIVAIFITIKTPIPVEIQARYKLDNISKHGTSNTTALNSTTTTISTEKTSLSNNPSITSTSQKPPDSTSLKVNNEQEDRFLQQVKLVNKFNDYRLNFLRWRQASNGGKVKNKATEFYEKAYLKEKEEMKKIAQSSEDMLKDCINLMFTSGVDPTTAEEFASLLSSIDSNAKEKYLIERINNLKKVEVKKALIKSLGDKIHKKTYESLVDLMTREKDNGFRLFISDYLKKVKVDDND